MKAFFCSLIICSAAIAAERTSLSGHVTDSEGAAVGSAHIFIRPYKLIQKYLYIETDSFGQFKAQINSGYYDLCIMANGFAPKCSAVLIKTGANDGINARLKASDVVVRSRGDVFN